MKTPTAGIILAAGESTRFGEPKQLLRLCGRFLLEWVLTAALDSNLDHVVLVLAASMNGSGAPWFQRRPTPNAKSS
jgi:CTP:molybdopterin cytidylyltransferase MocA